MSKQVVIKIYGIALLATIGLLSIYIFLNHHFNGSIWQAMTPSKSALTAEYCELDMTTHLFRQNMNTYSNLGYFFLGMIVILISLYDRKDKGNQSKNLIQQFPAISFLFGCCLVYLCLGSSFFHASLTWLGQRVDMNGTYSICITLIGISFYRLIIKQDAPTAFKRIFISVLVLIILAFVELHLIIPGTILLPALVGILVITTTTNYIRNKGNFNIQLALLSLSLMIGAFVIRTLDVEKFHCDPTSFFQGHALWHFFTGMSAFLLYWFYRSETSKDALHASR